MCVCKCRYTYIACQSIQCYWFVHVFSVDFLGFSISLGSLFLERALPRFSASLITSGSFVWKMGPCKIYKSILAYQLKLSSHRSCLTELLFHDYNFHILSRKHQQQASLSSAVTVFSSSSTAILDRYRGFVVIAPFGSRNLILYISQLPHSTSCGLLTGR